MDVNDFYDSLGKPVELPYPQGFVNVPVLEFLTGAPWNNIALMWVTTLRPDSIRVIKFGHSEKMDAHIGRVTVHLRENGTIDSIELEASVTLLDSIESGADLWSNTPSLQKKRHAHNVEQ